jgi:hypothetical protein
VAQAVEVMAGMLIEVLLLRLEQLTQVAVVAEIHLQVVQVVAQAL